MKTDIDEKAIRADVSGLLRMRGLRFLLSLVLAQAAAGLVAWFLSPQPTPENVLLWPFLVFFATGYFCFLHFSMWARPLGIEGAYLRWRFKRRYPPGCAERRLVLNLVKDKDIELFMALLLEGERIGGDTAAMAPVRGANLSLPFPPETPPPAMPPSLETTPGVIPLQPEARKGE